MPNQSSYSAIPEPTPIPASLTLLLPLYLCLYLSIYLSLFATLHFSTQTRCLSRVLIVRASSHLSISPPTPDPFPGRLPVPRPTLPNPSSLHPLQPRPPLTCQSPMPRIDIFFSPCPGAGVARSMKGLPDGARRATYIIVKHVMRATSLGIGNAPFLYLFACFSFYHSTRAAKVLDLTEVRLKSPR